MGRWLLYNEGGLTMGELLPQDDPVMMLIAKLNRRIQRLTEALETIATRQGHWTPDQTIAKKALENDK